MEFKRKSLNFTALFIALCMLLNICAMACEPTASDSIIYDAEHFDDNMVELMAMGDYGGNITGAAWYWPLHGFSSASSAYSKITSSYGYRGGSLNRYHKGVDIGASTGTSVYPVRNGTVSEIHNSTSGSAGRYIIINHNDGYFSIYMHLSRIDITQGQTVNTTTTIGAVGGSGYGSESYYGAHLHLGIHYGSYFNWECNVNPCPSGYTRIGESLQESAGGYPIGSATISYSVNPEIETPPDTEKPTISNVTAENISADSFTIKCDLNDNVGVTRVWLNIYGPNGSDGYGIAASNGTFSHTISASYGQGSYSVHIYAYDAAGNESEGVSFDVDFCFPSKPTIKNMNSQYYTADKIKVMWDSTENSTQYAIFLSRKSDNGNYEQIFSDFDVRSGYLLNHLEAGSYELKMQSINNTNGNWLYVESDKVYFDVIYDKYIPYTPTLTTNKNSYYPGEKAYFYFDTTLNTEFYGIIISKLDDTGNYSHYNTYWNVESGTNYIFPSGSYEAVVQSVNNHNEWNYRTSEIINFSVRYILPEKPIIIMKSSSFYTTDEIEFSWESIEHATQYALFISKIENNTEINVLTNWEATPGMKLSLSEGDYCASLQAINNSTGEWLWSASEKTLFSVKSSTEYPINFDTNGGENAPESQIKTYGIDLTLTTDIPTRNGYTFKGWATTSDGEVAYKPGDNYTLNEDVTLYAVWEKNKVLYGDIRGDGAVDVSDVIGILQILAGGGTDDLTDAQKTAADVNCDGNTDVSDVIRILQYLASPDTPLGPTV